MQKEQLYFENLDEKFDEFMTDYDVKQRKSLIFNHLLKNKLLKRKIVLEVGCGTGRFSAEIQRIGGQLIALDIGVNLVKNVSNTICCSGTVGDACSLPFIGNCFDFVISSECIEHTPDPVKAIREICRVCRPGGYICITSPNRLWYPVLLFAQRIGARKFAGIENWIYPLQAKKICREMKMSNIRLGGCHLLPFQLKLFRPLLSFIDSYNKHLFPLMINFGIAARKR